ncbi:hypothetical protein BJ165DRAFT_1531197 [Panaeolus papilionaceus]|nr:hypothetical protein BJ165DRAFT_1531197 [Panaeolus papilionaceus]
MTPALEYQPGLGVSYRRYLVLRRRELHILATRSDRTTATDTTFEQMYLRNLERLDREALQQNPPQLSSTSHHECTCPSCPHRVNPTIPNSSAIPIPSATTNQSTADAPATPTSGVITYQSTEDTPNPVNPSIPTAIVNPDILPAPTAAPGGATVDESTMDIPPPPYEPCPRFEFRPINFVNPRDRLPRYREHGPFQPPVTYLDWRLRNSNAIRIVRRNPSTSNRPIAVMEDSDSEDEPVHCFTSTRTSASTNGIINVNSVNSADNSAEPMDTVSEIDELNSSEYDTDPSMPSLRSISDDGDEDRDQFDPSSDDDFPPASSSPEPSDSSDSDFYV